MTKIQILGTGCEKCKKLAENAETAAKSAGIEYEIEKITKIEDIMAFSVMLTPAIVINGEVKSSGKLLSAEDIAKMLG